MSLDFVGVDPDSQQDKCPAVHVDPTTGDGLFVGKHVTDPLMLAEMASHVSIGADEAVIRMPARMWPIIAEAAAGTYEKGRRGPGRVSFADLLAVTQHSAVHLEMRDSYEPDNPRFLAWQAGQDYDKDSLKPWHELIGGGRRPGRAGTPCPHRHRTAGCRGGGRSACCCPLTTSGCSTTGW